jgi:hypothetical protein
MFQRKTGAFWHQRYSDTDRAHAAQPGSLHQILLPVVLYQAGLGNRDTYRRE